MDNSKFHNEEPELFSVSLLDEEFDEEIDSVDALGLPVRLHEQPQILNF